MMDLLIGIDEYIENEDLKDGSEELDERYNELITRLNRVEDEWNDNFTFGQNAQLMTNINFFKSLGIDFLVQRDLHDSYRLKFVIWNPPLTYLFTPLRENETKLSRYKLLLLLDIILDIPHQLNGEPSKAVTGFKVSLEGLKKITDKMN